MTDKPNKSDIMLTNNYLKTITDRERFDCAYHVSCFFAGKQNQQDDFLTSSDEMKARFAFLRTLDISRFEEVLNRIEKTKLLPRNNAFCSFVIFYIVSGGEYPQDCWRETVLEHDTLGKQEESFASDCKPLCNPAGAERFSQMIKSLRKDSMKRAVAMFTENTEVIGCVKIFEILWKVFVHKDCSFSPALFKKLFEEFASEGHVVRSGCEFRIDNENLQLFAVSCQGKKQKPMHVECEGACKVVLYAKTIWLAVCADGVGSAMYSSIGSLAAVNALDEIIRKFLENQGVIKGRQPTRKAQNVSITVWHRLMYYLRFSLASDLYDEWNKRLSEAKKNLFPGKTVTNESFLTTLQFAFGCPQFVACGRVGDGSFYVRKVEDVGASERRIGGVFLNDGISGVTQSAVLTVGHLKKNPTALLMSFFKPDEITDIVISSDGVSGAIGATVSEAEAMIASVNGLSFEEKCRKLDRTVKQCTEYNETRHGSGDDSTIVYVHRKDQTTSERRMLK